MSTLITCADHAISCANYPLYEAVLRRPEHRIVHRLDDVGVDRFLAALASASRAVETHFLWRPQLRDPDDEMVLEAAVNGRASHIVTHNVRDFGDAPARFGVEVVTPALMLVEVRNEQGDIPPEAP